MNLALPAAHERLSAADAYRLLDMDLQALLPAAAARRDSAHGHAVSYSRKVFIPLTQLCRDVCHYCTFAQTPRKMPAPYLSMEQVLEIARAGARAGCKEALFTLGDKPELRYDAARQALDQMGQASTLTYLADVARAVLEETGLLPHLNPGLMDADDLAALRQVSVSQGIMLESTSQRLCERGGAHHGSPDKVPAARLATIRLAGEAGVPFTSGILIGIGETRAERIDALLALRELQDAHGHIQEIIVQNFMPKVGTLMVNAPVPSLQEHLWTIAAARLIFDAGMNIQAPPNLRPGALRALVDAGINDWGGVSPVTPDHVNPEAPWPHLDALAAATRAAGKELTERLALYPAYARDGARWLDASLRTRVLHAVDSDGFARTDAWSPGSQEAPPVADLQRIVGAGTGAAPAVLEHTDIDAILRKARGGQRLQEAEIVRLFRARGAEFTAVCAAADALRRQMNGDTVSFVVNRNINYTNICGYRCQFCAFAKGKGSEDLRGKPYDLPLEEIRRRVREAWDRGATEVCMQGGIHPAYTGETYLDICRAVKAEAPGMHVHAFSPLEVWQGAATLGLDLRDYLLQLKEAGLSTLPGTAAEILDDEVRQVICHDKVTTDQWLQVMRTAHGVGLRSTATIMFGHVERLEHWARHLLRLRALQIETGGFTEFVPLPFVHMESPIYRKGRARRGPTFREAVLMHAVARLALHPVIPNIQASWVKLGTEGVRACLQAGVNDMGGTLMNETISRAAGAAHGQEMTAMDMETMLRSMGRPPRQRSTAYGTPPADAMARARATLAPVSPMRIDFPLTRTKARPGAATASAQATAPTACAV
jgi:FO synthase